MSGAEPRCDRMPRAASMDTIRAPRILPTLIAAGVAVATPFGTIPVGTALIITTLAVATILITTQYGNQVFNVPIGMTRIELPDGASAAPTVTSTATSTVWLEDFREI